MTCTVLFLLASCHDKDEDQPNNIEPKLCIGQAKNITRTEATVSGKIITYGNTPLPELKFVYGSGGKTDLASPTVHPDKEGNLTTRLTGLKPGTFYNFFLQSDNGRVTLNSSTASFTTLSNDPPTVSRVTLLSQGPTSVIVGYEILNDGGETVTETGCDVWEIASGDTVRIKSASPDICRIHIGGLKQHSSYGLRPYAINKVGEAKGEPLTFDTRDAVIWTEPGGLSDLIGEDLYMYTSLSFAGPMNGDDLRLLRKMMGRDTDESPTPGRLSHVDLTDATIVSGGGSYGSSRYSTDDVVGHGLFAYCDRLEYVALPSSAKVIEKDAFLDCGTLTRLGIPASAKEVTPSDGCDKLSEISISSANTYYQSIDGVLFNADASQIVWFPKGKSGNYALPSSVTSIGDYAFRGCRITKFTFPDGFKELGQGVFYGSMVEEVVTPASLRMLPTATFQNCTHLKMVYLGSGMELVSDYAFDGCPLEHIYIEASIPPVCNPDAFSTSYAGLFSTCTLHVPASQSGVYKADPTWGQFNHIIGIE